MTTLRQEMRVSPDGTITVAVGKEDAGRLVRVTVEPSPEAARASRDEWLAFLDRTAGKWIGDFPEIEDPPPAKRDEL